MTEDVELFVEMVQKGYEPNTVTVSTLINGLCKTRNVRDALQLSRNLESTKCMPDAYTYNTIISGFCKERFLNEAEGLLS